jgi:hypothetical protein
VDLGKELGLQWPLAVDLEREPDVRSWLDGAATDARAIERAALASPFHAVLVRPSWSVTEDGLEASVLIRRSAGLVQAELTLVDAQEAEAIVTDLSTGEQLCAPHFLEPSSEALGASVAEALAEFIEPA